MNYYYTLQEFFCFKIYILIVHNTTYCLFITISILISWKKYYYYILLTINDQIGHLFCHMIFNPIRGWTNDLSHIRPFESTQPQNGHAAAIFNYNLAAITPIATRGIWAPMGQFPLNGFGIERIGFHFAAKFRHAVFIFCDIGVQIEYSIRKKK